jgi:transposase InsO family protein
MASFNPMRVGHALFRLVSILFDLVQDVLQLLLLGTRSSAALKAENMFLRKQLALYLEREVKPRRASDATRLSMVLCSRLFAWQTALVNVKPDTFLSWHRKGFRLLWRWKSRPRGRPRVPTDLQELIVKMALENLTWVEERIAAELLLKLGIRVSPRTVRRYMPPDIGPRKRVPSQRWRTFVRNHARGILASDFLVVVTARFRVLYVFVVMEVGTRKIVHFNVTDHPTADWTLQQFREVMGEQSHRFVIHDRDSIYSLQLDSALKAMGLRVLKTPFQAPQANACCERVIGTIRRECLDFLIPLNERHLRGLLKEWVAHYNRGRPHSSLGPGIPDPGSCYQQAKPCGYQIPIDHRVVSKAILGGLHHEYSLERAAA